jgi:PAS domain S-box-containing protein
LKEVFRIVNKETREKVENPVSMVLRGGVAAGLPHPTLLVAHDSTECDIADSCTPICDHDGQVIGAVLVFRDVNKEHAIQQVLRDSTPRIQAILNTVEDGIITLHSHGVIVAPLNPAVEQMFGYTLAELIGQKITLLIPELDEDRKDGSLDYYLTSNQDRYAGIRHEVSGRRKDGSTFPLEIAISEMCLDGQRYFTGILRDITTRKQAEENLIKSEALYRSLVDTSQDLIWQCDAEGRYTYLNLAWEKVFGYDLDEMIGKKFSDFQTLEDAAFSLIEFDRLIAGNSVTGFEATHIGI